MSLAMFIKQENQLERMFPRKGSTGGPKWPEDTDLLLDRHKTEIADRLASCLSPEVLTCDGELRGAKLAKKAKMLQAAKQELINMGVTHSWW